MNGHGHDNPTFIGDSVYTIPGELRRNITQFYPGKNASHNFPPPAQFQVHEDKEPQKDEKESKTPKERDSWGKGIEFLWVEQILKKLCDFDCNFFPSVWAA